MSQKNDTKILIVALVLTLGLVGVGLAWVITELMPNLRDSRGNNANPSPSPISTPTPSTSSQGVISTGSRLSFGEQLLIPTEQNPDKERAAKALTNKNYTEAIDALETSLKTQKNDPEALIYLNNAKIGNEKSYAIAVSIPIGTDVNAAQRMCESPHSQRLLRSGEG